MDRSVRTARNAVVNLVAFLYPAILAIVVTPLFVHHVGTRAYGVYALSVAFISILGLLEFGAGIALMKFMPEPIARGDDESANEIMGAGVAFYGLLGLVGALISTIVGVFFVHSLFGVSGELTGQAQRAFVLGGIAFGLTVLMNVAGSVLGSLQDFAAATKVTLAVTTVSTGVAVTLVLLGAGLDGVMIGIVLQPALGMTFFAYAVRRRLPNLRFRPRWSSQIVRRLASLSAYVLIGNVSGLILFQFDKFYIGIAGGLAAVTFYVVPGTLAGRLHAAGATLTSVSLPAASDLFARGDLWRVHVLYRRAAWLTTLSVGAIAVPAILFSGQLLKHWLGPSFAAHSTHVLEILVATYFVLALSALPYWLAMAAGRPRCTGVFIVPRALQ